MTEFENLDNENINTDKSDETEEFDNNEEIINESESSETLEENQQSDEYTDEEIEYDDSETPDETKEETTGEESEINPETKEKKTNVFLEKIKLIVATWLFKFLKLDKKKRTKYVFTSIVMLILAVLIFTDIIPILPNSFNRSYVGNEHSVGETKWYDAEKYSSGVLYASNGSVKVFGPDMKIKADIETFSGAPIVRTQKKGAIVYTKGGKNVIVMSDDDKYNTVKATDEVISASVNKRGDYVLVTKEAGYTACVSAYDFSGKAIYKWHTGNNIVDSALSPKSTEIVASAIEYSDTSVCSKLVFLNTSEKTPVSEIKLDSNIVTEIRFLDANTVIAIGDSFTTAYTPSGNQKWHIDYDGKLLKTYDITDDGEIAFLFGRFNSSKNESVVEIYNFRGRRIGEFASSEYINSISMNNGFCLLGADDKTVLIDNDGDVKKEKSQAENYSELILFKNYNFAFGLNNNVGKTVSVKH